MIRVATAIVADGTKLICGDACHIGNQIFDGLAIEICASDCVIHLVDVRLMMLGVMDFHRSRIYMRLKGIVGIRQGR